MQAFHRKIRRGIATGFELSRFPTRKRSRARVDCSRERGVERSGLRQDNHVRGESC